jgi:tripartite-type tricarboxylate transporter receptor subunit TctC
MKKLIVISLVLLFGISSAMAGEPVKIVVGLAPGGSTDLTARLLAKYISLESNLAAVVENRPGGESKIAMSHLQTITQQGSSAVFLSHSSNLITTTARTDLLPLQYVTSAKTHLVVRSDSNLVAENLCHSDRNITVGVGGNFTHGEIFLKMLPSECRKNFTIITYKSGAPAVVDLIGGHIDAFAGGPAVVKAFVDSGRARVLASLGPIADGDVPVFRPDIYRTASDIGALYLLVDRNMSQSQIEKLTPVLDKVIKNKNFLKELSDLGLTRLPTRQPVQQRFVKEIVTVQSIVVENRLVLAANIMVDR